MESCNRNCVDTSSPCQGVISDEVEPVNVDAYCLNNINFERAGIGFLFLNVQGLNKKSAVLENFVSDLNRGLEAPILFLCLTEHWLSNDELAYSHPEGFYCSSHFCRTNHIRGGTAIFVANDIEARALNIDNFISEFNLEAAVTIVDKFKIIIMCIYHSPGYDPYLFLSALESLLTFLSKWEGYIIVAGGDFNADFDVTTSKPTALEFLNLLRQFNCFCINSEPTRGNSCLDNVFVNCQHNQVKCTVVKDFLFSDHDGLTVSLITPKMSFVSDTDISNSISLTKLVLPSNNVPFLIEKLKNTDWSLLTLENAFDALTVFNIFFKTLTSILDCFLISKHFNTRNKVVKTKGKWYTPNLAKTKDKILSLDFLYKSTGSEVVKAQLTALKKEYTKEISEAKASYNSKLINGSKNKCKAAWDLIKTSCNLSGGINKPMISPKSFNMYCVESVDKLKKDMVKPNVSAKNCLHKTNNRLNESFEWRSIVEEDVLKATKHLSNSHSDDYYNMSNSLLKIIIPYIVSPLTICINRILQEGIFPDILKISKVCPLFKKGDKGKPESYRPVSLVPVVSKLVEILICGQVNKFLEKNKIVSRVQFGFRKGKATIDAVESLVSDVIQAFEDKCFAQVTFCDLSKAFDCVNHSDVLEKLEYYGFRGRPLSLFESYLKDRKQAVYINGEWSDLVGLKYGVPQGSVLGPLLFLISINDLPHNVVCRTVLYADDTTFLNISNNFSELSNLVNVSLADAGVWFKANGYLLNENKTENVIFSLRPYDNELADHGVVDSVKFLGVHVDHQLTWGKHIDYLKSRLSRVVYLIGRLKHCVTTNSVRMAYFAFFQSIIKYCLLLWGNSARIDEILKLQKKVVRIISNAKFLDHCKPLFIKLKIKTIINLYIFELATYSLKKMHYITLNKDIHSHNTRNKAKMSFQYCRLEKSLKSHTVISKKVYNKLLECICKYCDNQTLFLKKLDTWLVQNPFYSVEEFFENADVNF